MIRKVSEATRRGVIGIETPSKLAGTLPGRALTRRVPVVRVLEEIVTSINFCCGVCAIGSRPVRVLVTVVCEDGLAHEYERDVDTA